MTIIGPATLYDYDMLMMISGSKYKI